MDLNKGIYLFKFLMAILVVVIHTTSWKMWGLTGTAVPYFFIASGFFLFRKTDGKSQDEKLSILGKWIWKALKLYLIWSLVYLPFAAYNYIQEGLPFAKAIVHYLRNLFFVGENFMSWPLWFLLAMVWAGALIWIMTKLRIPLWAMFGIGAMLAISKHLIDFESIPLYTKIFRDTRNGIFIGLLYLTTGGLLQRIQWKGRPLLWAAASLAMLAGLHFSDWFLWPLTVALFLLSKELRFTWMSENAGKALGSFSKTVYLVHMLFAGTLILFAQVPKPSTGLFLMTLALSIATAAIVYFKPCRKSQS